MMETFIWPRPRFRITSNIRYRWATVKSLEQQFADFYPGTFPVLFPSSRASLTSILQLLGLWRPDHVWVPPFCCYVTLECIAKVATPTPDVADLGLRASVPFHQWGFVHQCDLKGEIIEDSADSLCLPGKPLFPNQGRFELFSLPKLLGCFMGGLVLCRRIDDSEGLKEIRDKRTTNGWVQFMLKSLILKSELAHGYWHGTEALNGSIPRLACNDIQSVLGQLETIIRQRKERIEMVRPLAPAWLKFHPDRLSCCIPFECSPEAEPQARQLGLDAGWRHFNRTQNSRKPEVIKVLPVPVHQDIDIATLMQLIKILPSQNSSLVPPAPAEAVSRV